MRKIILLFISLFFLAVAQGQTGFTINISIPVSDGINPMTIPWSGGIDYPLFSQIDLNNDGVMDLFVMDRHNNRVLTFVNNGTTGPNSWVYAPQYERQFPPVTGWACLFDYNCDGKPDLFTDSYLNNGIAQYRNDSPPGGIVFTLVDSSMRGHGTFGNFNLFASSYLVPNLNDIDGDGDLDVLGQQFSCVGAFAYYKNMSMEDYGVCDSLNDYILETNAWGKFAIRAGAYSQVAVGYYNINCQSQLPEADQSQAARRDDTYANIFTLDVDNDGDMDALVGDSQTNNSLLIINAGSTSSAFMNSEDTLFPSYNVPVKISSFSAHSYVDADNDGVKDLLVGQSEFRNYGGIQFYKNLGTDHLPNFDLQQTDFLQAQSIDVGEGASPVFFDADADGLKDMIIGNKKITDTDTTGYTSLTLYKNVGTTTAPAFQYVTSDYASFRSYISVAVAGVLNPTFGDLDNDGDLDMIIGIDNGQLVYMQNCAAAGLPATFCAPVFNYMSIDVGNAATPQLIDLNRDGLLDLLVGEKNGILNYYQNLGSTTFPFFSTTPTVSPIGGINLQTTGSTDGNTSGFIFDQQGTYRLAVACMRGDVYLYGNIDGNLNGNWTVLDTLIRNTAGSRYGNNITVSGGDINGDSLTDLIFGLYGGGVQIFGQNNPQVGIQAVHNDNETKAYPNPNAGNFVIKSDVQNGNYQLLDHIGQIVAFGKIVGGYAIFDHPQLADGIYVLSVNSSCFQKIVICH